MLRSFILGSGLFFIMACQPTSFDGSAYESDLTYRHGVKASGFFHGAIENKLTFEQLYSLAAHRLQENLRALPDNALPPAIILDIDETVLDNSPYELENIQKKRIYTPETWKQWTAKAEAKALPGAVAFCKLADSLGVKVFYISNREVDEQAATEANLLSVGFPQVQEGHVLLKSDSSDKTSRRETVKANHAVVLLLGDNLRDFDEIFVRKADNIGMNLLEEYRDTLHQYFIMFPNPMYGEWEKAMENWLKDPVHQSIPAH
jgi:5'-nucleotidase (lipoprotein e(P4) family)